MGKLILFIWNIAITVLFLVFLIGGNSDSQLAGQVNENSQDIAELQQAFDEQNEVLREFVTNLQTYENAQNEALQEFLTALQEYENAQNEVIAEIANSSQQADLNDLLNLLMLFQ